MGSFGFVILHYKTYNETYDTIKSIVSIPRDGREIAIVVVDNASNNGSLEKLTEDFKDYKEITFLLNRENLGFSKGNNVGFAELKKRGYDFIILSNNDIEVLSQDFYSKVEDDYEKYKFAVLGPGIKNPDKGRTGCRTLPPTIKFAKGRIFRLRLKYYASHLYRAYEKRINNNRMVAKPVEFGDNYLCIWKNVTLHGCFLIFSKEYISRFDGLNPATFMYAEEELLFIRLMSAGLVSVYDPKIEIFHKEGVATAYDGKTMSKEGYERHMKAQKVLLQELKKYPDVQKIRGKKL